jgi:hypothetical protein
VPHESVRQPLLTSITDVRPSLAISVTRANTQLTNVTRTLLPLLLSADGIPNLCVIYIPATAAAVVVAHPARLVRPAQCPVATVTTCPRSPSAWRTSQPMVSGLDLLRALSDPTIVRPTAITVAVV